jgi:hypothetical protein
VLPVSDLTGRHLSRPATQKNPNTHIPMAKKAASKAKKPAAKKKAAKKKKK